MPTYNPSVTAQKFHSSDKFVRAIMGPVGGGKSVACCMEIISKASQQEANYRGHRKSRWAIIRNSYRELQDTTINTFFDWIPPGLGKFKQIDMTWRLKEVMEDGTVLDLEVLFRALDKPNDVKKLLSLELTGAFVNEAREVPKQILDMLQTRVGRYPNKMDGGASWFGVILDTNPPDEDHWWYNLFEENDHPDFALFKQPSGISPDAENVENLPHGYYDRMQQGKDPGWVNVYVHGKYGFVSDGMPVVPEFHDNVHVADHHLEFQEKVLYIGVDFGRTPAAVFGQEIEGQMQIVDELCTFGVSATFFAGLLAERIKGHFPRDVEIIATGDPAGENQGEQVDDTCIEILQNAGIPIDGAHTNNFTIRRDSVAISLTSLNMQGQPQLMISPKCTMLRKGMNGGYKYRRMQVSGEVFQQKPDKNKYSHVCEALQYLMLGYGKGYEVLSSHSNVSQFKVVGALR
jgi:hypothetical protein